MEEIVMGFSYTNTTPSAHNVVTGVNLGLQSNYAVTKDDAGEVRISNTTASLEQPEVISYRFTNTEKVWGSAVKPKYPAMEQSAVKYNVRIDSIYRETVGDHYIDHPMAIQLTVSHELSSTVTEAVVDELLTRLLGACYDETNQSYRFMDMARGSIQPIAD
jgi:hypothetical protein